MNKHNQKGFTLVEGSIVLVAFVALLVVAIFVQRGISRKGVSNSPSSTPVVTATNCGQVTVSPTASSQPATTYMCSPGVTNTVKPGGTTAAVSTVSPAASTAPKNTVSSSPAATPTPSATTVYSTSPSSTVSPTASPR